MTRTRRVSASRGRQLGQRPAQLRGVTPDQTDRFREHVVEVLLDLGADLLGEGLHERLVLDRLRPTELDGVDRLQEADLELGRQVAEHPQRAEPRERRGDREVDQPREPPQEVHLAEDRRRLLGADHAGRDQLCLRSHRRLDEAAAAEAPQPVAVAVELLGALAALGKDEHELLLVGEQPVHVRGVCGHPADLRDQHREARGSP